MIWRFILVGWSFNALFAWTDPDIREAMIKGTNKMPRPASCAFLAIPFSFPISAFIVLETGGSNAP